MLRKLLLRRKPKPVPGDDTPLLNYALELAQEWGEYWLQPIQGRLGGDYPELSAEDLDRYDALARDAMKAGHDLVYALAEAQSGKVDQTQWRARYLERYPWVDERNLKHLFSTGMYYAQKDGAGGD